MAGINNSCNNEASIWTVDNLRLDGNTLSSINTNGNIVLDPNGSGLVNIASAYTLPRVDGSSDYVLKTNGSGTVSWQPETVGSGWVLLDTKSGSASTSIPFTSLLSSTYDTYALVFKSLRIPARLTLQFSSNNGSSYINSGYISAFNNFAYNSSTWSNTNVTSGFVINDGGANYVCSGVVYLMGVTSGTFPITMTNGTLAAASTTQLYPVVGGGWYPSGTVMNAFQLLSSSGNLSSGSVSLYGIAS